MQRAFHYRPTTWLKGRIYPCCFPWPLTYNERSLTDMHFWFPCVETIYRCQNSKTPKAVSFTQGVTDRLGVAFLSHHLKLPGSELWIKQREKAKHFNIFLLKICSFLFSYYSIKSNLFHDKLFQGYVIVTMFIYIYIYIYIYYNKWH